MHQRRAQEEIRRLDTSEALARFEEFEYRLDLAESEADLVNYGRVTNMTLEDKFAEMERDELIEDELKALKETRQKQPVG